MCIHMCKRERERATAVHTASTKSNVEVTYMYISGLCMI